MSVLHIIIIKSADESRSQSEEYLPNGSQYAYNNGLSTGRNRSFLGEYISDGKFE